MDFAKMWSRNKWPRLRFGQAFCNYFNITNSVLFYTNDSAVSGPIIASYLKEE